MKRCRAGSCRTSVAWPTSVPSAAVAFALLMAVLRADTALVGIQSHLALVQGRRVIPRASRLEARVGNVTTRLRIVRLPRRRLARAQLFRGQQVASVVQRLFRRDRT